MTAEEVYDWLIAASTSSAADAFDAHALASIIAVAFAEAEEDGASVLSGLGLDKASFLLMARAVFPAAAGDLLGLVVDEAPQVAAEEQSIRDLLALYSSDAGVLQNAVIAMVARRCQSPHHLWQDLGLRSRQELRTLMTRRFAPLAAKNKQDMKWKKFLYRMVCGSEGFTLCAAPVCSDCDEFHVCFGAEDGESRLARARSFGPVSAGPLPEAAE